MTNNSSANSPATVMVLSADLGGGHDALARGLAREIGQVAPGSTVVIENGLRLASAHFSEIARESYRSTVERTPWSYQLWFWILSANAIARVVRWLAWRGLRTRILARIREVDPAVIVSTYPFMTAVLGKLRRDGDLTIPAVALLIDSGPHDLWIAPGVDLHVAMNPADCDRVRSAYPKQHYYPPLHVTSARPAVDDRCREPHDRDAARREFNLPLDQPVLLVSGGSWGLALRDEDLAALVEQTDTFIAVACGHNEELMQQLTRDLPRDRVRAIGFTTDMPALLACSDAALLNAGGMTCYECFALGTPVLLFEPLAGHGVNAAKALDHDGLASYVRNQRQLIDAVRGLGDMESSADLAARAARAHDLSDQPMLADVVRSATLQAIPPGEAITTTLGRRLVRSIGGIIVAATAIGIAVSLWSQRDAIASFDWSLSPFLLAVALALFAAGPIAQALAFWLLLRLLGVVDVRIRDACAVWSWSSLASYAPTGVASYVVRVRERDRLSATRSQVLAASIYEQGILAIAVALFSATAFLIAGSHVPATVATIALVGTVVLFAISPRMLGNRLLKLMSGSRAPLPHLPRGRGLALVVVINVAGWLLTGCAAVTALSVIGHDRPELAWVIGAYSFAWLMGFLMPLAPGGLGIREGVLASVMAPHYGIGVAVSLALALRVIHTAGDLLASAAIEGVYRVGLWRRRRDTTPERERPIEQAARLLRALTKSGLDHF